MGRIILTNVAIALGSNLGDRGSQLQAAVSRLAAFLSGLRTSHWYETAPVGSGPQPRFLNGAAVGETDASPRELLEVLLAIERGLGRERPVPLAARTLDLDLVLFGDVTLNEPGLELPHPRFRERRFVLEPLAEIAPEMRDPITGLTVGELFNRLSLGDGRHQR